VHAHGAIKKESVISKRTLHGNMAKHPLISTRTQKWAVLFEVYEWLLRTGTVCYIRFDLQEPQSDGNFKFMDMTQQMTTV
jgi:hypothetical protein